MAAKPFKALHWWKRLILENHCLNRAYNSWRIRSMIAPRLDSWIYCHQYHQHQEIRFDIGKNIQNESIIMCLEILHLILFCHNDLIHTSLSYWDETSLISSKVFTIKGNTALRQVYARTYTDNVHLLLQSWRPNLALIRDRWCDLVQLPVSLVLQMNLFLLFS